FLGALLSALLVFVLTIYFMLDLPRLRRGLVRLFPRRNRRAVNEAVNIVIDKVGAYMIGNLIISAIAGVATFVALELLRVPFALLLAALLGGSVRGLMGALMAIPVAAAIRVIAAPMMRARDEEEPDSIRTDAAD